ncbi:MAG: iron uptake transporter deferrochelatase/peroxidase subunit [Actinocatenispora sp.]
MTGASEDGGRRLGRRDLLTAALSAGVGGAATAGGFLAAGQHTGDRAAPAPRPVSFHGTHQAGITDPAPARSTLVSFDVLAADRDELRDLLRALTDRARWLTAGGTPTDPGIEGPPADSGMLGPRVPTGPTTVTVGVGASLFDDRYGLADRRPADLRTMAAFPNDELDEAWCHGDLSVHICAPDTDTVIHALRDLTRHTRGAMQIRWRIDGFLSPPRPSGTPRNLMGFKDGTANLDTTDRDEMRDLVWGRGPHGPQWTVGGTYQVARLIRMRLEFWDRISLSEQENIFGRRRDSGAPMDGAAEHDRPHYPTDPIGTATPLTSHIRRANPRTPASASSRLLRRPYNYDRGVDSVGDLDMGLIFLCYQRSITHQFAAVQKRLADEPLVDYIAPFGGGYFFVLPGVRDDADHYGRGLFS